MAVVSSSSVVLLRLPIKLQTVSSRIAIVLVELYSALLTVLKGRTTENDLRTIQTHGLRIAGGKIFVGS